MAARPLILEPPGFRFSSGATATSTQLSRVKSVLVAPLSDGVIATRTVQDFCCLAAAHHRGTACAAYCRRLSTCAQSAPRQSKQQRGDMQCLAAPACASVAQRAVSRHVASPSAVAWQRSSSGARLLAARHAGPRTGAALRVCAAAGVAGIEAVEGVRPEIDAAVASALDHCITDTDLGIGKKYKVSHRSSRVQPGCPGSLSNASAQTTLVGWPQAALSEGELLLCSPPAAPSGSSK